MGWICAARDLVQKVVLAKQAADLHCATLNQIVIHRVALEQYDEQVERIVGVYSKRRDAMLNALSRYMPDGVAWTRPTGGMFVWVTLPPYLDGAELLSLSLREEGVAFVPGAAFFADGGTGNALRLNYSLQSEQAIDEGIRRLSGLVARELRGTGRCAAVA